MFYVKAACNRHGFKTCIITLIPTRVQSFFFICTRLGSSFINSSVKLTYKQEVLILNLL